MMLVVVYVSIVQQDLLALHVLAEEAATASQSGQALVARYDPGLHDVAIWLFPLVQVTVAALTPLPEVAQVLTTWPSK